MSTVAGGTSARVAARAGAVAGRRAPAVVRLEGVSRWYGDVIALNDVDLQLGPGVHGLLGPNGAGKTTLIRLLVGLADPGDGRVLLDGQPVRNNLAALARIGYVPDGDGLYDELSARRFLVDQALLRGFPPAAAGTRADEVLTRVGLVRAADRPSGGFSKGMRQRLKLAQALLHDPDVLVLDEPLTGLDPLMRRDVTRVVKELGDEGVTVLVSSHVLHEVEAMTDRVVLLRHGQVLAEGTVVEIRDHLDVHARHLRIEGPDARALGRLLLREGDLVLGLRIDGEALIVETRGADRLCEMLSRAAAAGELDLRVLQPLDEDLQSVFTYLVGSEA